MYKVTASGVGQLCSPTIFSKKIYFVTENFIDLQQTI